MKSDDCKLGICIMVGLAAENIPAFCPDTCPLVMLNTDLNNLIESTGRELDKLIKESQWARFEINAMHGEIAELRAEVEELKTG